MFVLIQNMLLLRTRNCYLLYQESASVAVCVCVRMWCVTCANCDRGMFLFPQSDQQLDCALDLMRRLPPQQIEKNLSDLIDLVSIGCSDRVMAESWVWQRTGMWEHLLKNLRGVMISFSPCLLARLKNTAVAQTMSGMYVGFFFLDKPTGTTVYAPYAFRWRVISSFLDEVIPSLEAAV